MAKDVARNYKH